MWINFTGEKTEYPDKALHKALAFLEDTDLNALQAGSVLPIDGEAIFAEVQEYTSVEEKELRFETHDTHYDLQYMVRGVEFIGIVKREGLETAVVYDAEKDITFYKNPALGGRTLLEAGDCVLISPEVAHKPRCAAGKPGTVKKIVIKIKV
jgi:YhcH/YjgK/YiaL family protein